MVEAAQTTTEATTSGVPTKLEPAGNATTPPRPTAPNLDLPESTRAEGGVVRGHTIIRDEVVAKIAGLAVREVEGVHELVPFGASQRVSAFARRITGDLMRQLGVQVEVGVVQAAVDVRIITEHGASITEIARGIRERVRSRIERMTGLEVVEVNVEVVDLYFPTAAKASPGRSRQLS